MAYRAERYSSDYVAESGTEWDDGAYVRVKKIKMTHDGWGITLVQFDYVDAMGATVNGLVHGAEPFKFDSKHGRVTRAGGVSNEFTLADDEYIYTVVAYSSGYRVRKLEFQTNKQLIAFGVEADNPESIKRREEEDESFIFEYPATYGDVDNPHIVGFHGKSGVHYLHEFGVYLSYQN